MKNTDALIALVRMVRNKESPTKFRLEACETLLDYESPPEVIEFVLRFLAETYKCKVPYKYNDPCTVSEVDKLKALKLTRRAEAAKIKPRYVEPMHDSSNDVRPDLSRIAERERMMRARQNEVGGMTADERRAMLQVVTDADG